MSICSLLAVTSVIPKNMCLNCFLLESWPGASHSSCIICCCWHTSCRENHIISRQSQDVTRYRYMLLEDIFSVQHYLKSVKLLYCVHFSLVPLSVRIMYPRIDWAPACFFFYIHVSMLPLEVHKCWSTAKVWS